MMTEERGGHSLAGWLVRCRATVREVVLPRLMGWFGIGYGTLRQRLLPAVGKGTTRLRGELVKIHRQQNWLHRCSTTFSGNAAGLGVAMLSTKLVESLVERREASNLWGLLADRPLVSERTFEVLSFGAEYLLALIVFTITEYYLAEYKRKREVEARELPVAAGEEEGR